jgi:outer membrane protein OmpA-like peptidoglycan-associated protein
MGNKQFPVLLILLCLAVSSVQGQQAQFSSESTVDWVQHSFSSRITYDLLHDRLPFPSGRNAAFMQIKNRLPLLLKDPLLSLNVDSMTILGDWVVDQRVNLAELSQVINNAKYTAGVLNQDSSGMLVEHSLALPQVSALLVRHRVPYTPRIPIEQVPTRPYTGIVIDARGTLPVHGEFGSEKGEPCFFPRIWDDTMDLFYERNMADPQRMLDYGIVQYDYTADETRYQSRIGRNPLRITARKIFGINRTDPVIARADALRVLSSPENRKLLEDGRVVILLDQDMLIHPVSSPDKNENYYIRYEEVRNILGRQERGSIEGDKNQDITVRDSPRGIEITIQDIRFGPDTAELLLSEADQLNLIADTLQGFAGQNYTIMVEGYAAATGQPEGEMTLSIQRAQTVVGELTSRGIPEAMFTYRGYGGSDPVADNTTPEGRALNRRVRIVVMPQNTFVERLLE